MKRTTSAPFARLTLQARLVCLLASTAILSSCAINALRVEDAGRVAAASSSAASATTSYLKSVDLGRENTNIELAAVDSACARPRPQLRPSPDTSIHAPPVGFLCETNPQPDAPGTLSLLPITDEFKPTIALSRSLAAYGEGLAALVDDKDARPASEPFAEALEFANAAQSALDALTGGAGTAVPKADDKRVKAATTLIDFLGGLAREAKQVSDLRAYLAAHPQGIAAAATDLEAQVSGWDRSRMGDAGIRILVVDALVAKTLNNPAATVEQRRQALQKFYAVRDQNRIEAQLAPALLHTIDTLVAADKDLRRLIVPHPDLSKAERKKIADLNRQRIVTALNDLAALASAIRGG